MKATNIETADYFGYKNFTFSRWKNTIRFKRIGWLKLGYIMEKRDITAEEALALIEGAINAKKILADELEKLEAKDD